MMLYIFVNFCQNTWNGFQLRADTYMVEIAIFNIYYVQMVVTPKVG